MAHDVFVSYSSQDKLTADAVCAALERHAIRCWIAPRDVLPGSEWGEAIVNAIRGSRVMVMVFSARANQSRHIRREVERAVSQGIAIVPFRIEEIVPSSSLEYFIGSVHWLDALTPPLEQHLNNLSAKIKLLLAQVTLHLDDEAGPKQAKKETSSSEGASSTIESVPPTAPDPPRFCIQCGAPNRKALKFCTQCGASLVVTAKNCARCGTRNSEGMKFCTSCGTKL